MNKQRLEAERLIYSVMDKMDPSGANKEYWMNEFNNLSDEQFKKYISRPSSGPTAARTARWWCPAMDRSASALPAKKSSTAFG